MVVCKGGLSEDAVQQQRQQRGIKCRDGRGSGGAVASTNRDKRRRVSGKVLQKYKGMGKWFSETANVTIPGMTVKWGA